MPGSIRNPLARGCHALLREGATLVESASDVLQALGSLLPHLPASGPAVHTSAGEEEGPSDPDHLRVLESLGYDPVPIDALVERSGLTAEAVSSILLLLELRGLVESHGGGRYTRAGRGP